MRYFCNSNFLYNDLQIREVTFQNSKIVEIGFRNLQTFFLVRHFQFCKYVLQSETDIFYVY